MNKKGVTLIEIIVSIALISIILLLFTRLLISLNKENNISEEQSKYRLNQSIIIKDITKKTLEENGKIAGINETIEKNSDSDGNYSLITLNRTDVTRNTCVYKRYTYIKIYENKLYSFLYLTAISGTGCQENTTNDIIKRSLPSGGKYLLDDITIKNNCSTYVSDDINNCVFIIKIPVVDSFNKHYDIEIPGTYLK